MQHASGQQAQKPEPKVTVNSGRGPAYPFIPLEKAVERAEQMRDANLIRIAASPIAIYKVWGYGGDNGKSRQTMAALNHFGLLEYVGRGDQRQVRLSGLSHRIVLDRVPDSLEKAAALREAALLPAIYAKLWNQYGAALPLDVVIDTFLTRDCGYGIEAAGNVLEGYKETFRFAGLDAPSQQKPDSPTRSDKTLEPNGPEVGDLVQVEVDGELVLEHATRLRAIKDHEGRKWGFVDGSETGFLLENAIVDQKGDSARSTVNFPTLPIELLESATTSIVGEREWLRGPLSKAASYRLFVLGEIGPREIGKLIKLLEAQKAVLADDDDED